MTFRTLVPFLAIAFGVTWGIAAVVMSFPDQTTVLFGELNQTNPLFLCAVYSPAIAAFFLVFRGHGADGIRRYLARLALWRCSPAWYAFLVAGIPILVYSAVAINGTLGDEPFPFSPWHQAIPALALALVIGPIEEFGWRGLALPLLQQRFAPFWAGSILGAIWAVWHIPAFLVEGTPQSAFSLVPFLLAVLAISIVMTALFNASRGSLLLPALMHFQLNNPIFPDAQPYDALLFALAAVVIVVMNRKTMFQREGAVTDVFISRLSAEFEVSLADETSGGPC